MTRGLLGAFLVAAALVSACSSDASSEDVTAACTQLATSLCAKQACSGPFAAYPDTATCQTARANDCLTASKRSGTGYTQSALTTCSQQVDATDCFAFRPVLEGASCAFLYTGSLAEQAPCQRYDQCASGSCSAAFNQCGVCQAVAQEGAACTNTPCAPHLTCTSGACVRFRGEGEMCVTTGAGPKCDFPLACVNGTCQDANAASGAVCNFDSDTCDTSQSLVCNVTDDSGMGLAGTCQAITIVPAGQSCNAGGTACAPGVTCVVGASDATCVTDPAEGAACDPKSAPCLFPLACVNGTCVQPLANACP